MSSPLRSDFEPGTTRWAVRRAQWRSMGLSDADIARPKIAVINSSSSLSSCYSHLDQLSSLVQASIRESGGLPFEIRTVAPSDFVTSAGREARYLMPSRELIVNDVEAMVEGAVLDGMVCLSSCDKTAPAHLMAAARLNIPSILVIGGYQPSGVCGGTPVDIDDVYEAVGGHATGSVPLDDLTCLTDAAIGGPGVCTGLGTANSMHIVAEALGMTMPGSAPVRAASARMEELAVAAGRRIVSLVQDGGPLPSHIITPSAIRNAVSVAVAIGASVNVVRHIAAIATEAQLSTDVIQLVDDVSRSTPLLCGIRPNAPGRIESLEDAGGACGVMYQLANLIDTSAQTVAGTVSDRLSSATPPDASVIHTLDAPYAPHGGLAILRGSLAPNGSIIKSSAVWNEARQFSGSARVFEAEADAMRALADGDIRRGEVVVLRGLGPRGGPGTVFAAGFVAALVGAGLSEHVAVVTDGELSGLNRGFTVGQVMPEAADGGPLGAVEEGDEILIDLDKRTIDLEVSDDEIERRLREHPLAIPPAPRGWLSIYRSVVSPIERGATLVDPVEDSS